MTTKRPGPKSATQLQALSDSGNEEAPVTLFLHCQRAYQHMLEQAKQVNIDTRAFGEDEDPAFGPPETMIVWEGMLTRFITQELNLSVPYYSSVTQALKNMGCIRQLRRGGGTSPSQWELMHEPNEEDFNAIVPKKEVKQNSKEMMQDQIVHLSNRITALEDFMQQIIRQAS